MKQLKGYEDSREKYYNLAKKSVSSMNTAELKKLGNSGEVRNLFSFLFEILYQQSSGGKSFNDAEFRRVALGREAGDFESRLATFDIRKIQKDSSLKQKFNDVRNAKYQDGETNASLIDLLSWMDYMYESYIASMEIEQ